MRIGFLKPGLLGSSYSVIHKRPGKFVLIMDLSRLSEVTPKDLERVEKYERAYAILEEADSRQQASA